MLAKVHIPQLVGQQAGAPQAKFCHVTMAVSVDPGVYGGLLNKRSKVYAESLVQEASFELVVVALLAGQVVRDHNLRLRDCRRSGQGLLQKLTGRPV